VGELFRNHGVELVLRHLRRNCQCLHLKQALTRTAIQSLHTLAAFGRRATNHVSCMTKLEIRRVLPRIIKDMCLLSIKNMRGVCLRMLSLNKAASPWNVDMPYKMKDRLYIYTYGCFLCQNFLSIHGSHRESKIYKTCVSHHHLRDQRTYTAQKEQERKQASAVLFLRLLYHNFHPLVHRIKQSL
jgi:hypothetical protein